MSLFERQQLSASSQHVNKANFSVPPARCSFIQFPRHQAEVLLETSVLTEKVALGAAASPSPAWAQPVSAHKIGCLSGCIQIPLLLLLAALPHLWASFIHYS